ncbi:MFS transporter [Prosthecobacter vanneervenii]|uniref:MFS family permease n=1 Tax=Prosthecobacter vanneervenii TaxID=48466 RepID=A0A7W8DKS2_9BACT|nr:MFS transporter [Prosthecobacter vanneervenii]MBB5033437.1 MFS family permease [Prosthecobacter vanneervenii]
MPDSPPAPSSLKQTILRGAVLALFCWAVGWLAMYKLALGVVAGWVIGGATFGIGLYAIANLKGAPAGLWVTFGLKLLSVTCYKILMVVMVSYLSKDCGMSAANAQYAYAVFGFMMSCCTLLAGSITDAIGLRRTLTLGVSLAVLARVIMISASNPWIALTAGLVPVAVGEALCTPVLVAATRKFSTAEQRSVAFSVFYALLNLGFLAAYFIFDGVKGLSNGGMTIHTWVGDHSVQRVLFAVSAGIEVVMLPVLLLLRERDALGEDVAEGASAPMQRMTAGEAVAKSARLFSKLLSHPGFPRLLMFLAVIGLLKIVFSIMDGVLPTFLERELGAEGGARAGRANAVNSVLILILAPIAGILTRKIPAYPMVIFGGFITALSFVFLALPSSFFQGLADGPLGQAVIRGYFAWQGTAHPLFLMVVLWQVVFSIGEAFYSPRVYEYAVSIAPRGQEASYAALSAVPLILGKITTGTVFAWLLTSYCPETGPRDTATMWSIVGGLVLMAPLLLLVLRPFIRMKEEGKE